MLLQRTVLLQTSTMSYYHSYFKKIEGCVFVDHGGIHRISGTFIKLPTCLCDIEDLNKSLSDKYYLFMLKSLIDIRSGHTLSLTHIMYI